jgi:hypothetical protein
MISAITSGLLLFLFTSNLPAGVVSEKTALQVAARYVESLSPVRSSTPELTLVYAGSGISSGGLRTGEGEPLLYVYNVAEENGFVIIAGDDQAFPVLGYAGKGSFGTGEMPENLSHWLAFYEKEIACAIENGYAATEKVSQQWQALRSGSVTGPSPGYVLETAKWSQEHPYNYLCPMDGDRLSMTGCVATAMATVMRYHQWPEKGTGSNRYTCMLNGEKVTLYEPFAVSYDWKNMRDTYNTSSYWNETESHAVAQLMYHCGVAVSMSYSSSSSGAFSYNMQKALIRNFGYDEGAYLAYRDLYSAGEWHSLIRKELDNRCPVLYSGETEDQSGHLFVVDGYTEDDYYHVNWGWNGSSNGYFRLSVLDPYSQGAGGGGESANFCYHQDALIGMKPAEKNTVPRYEVFFIKHENTDTRAFGIYSDADKIVKGEPFNLYYTYIYNYGYRTFPGPFAFFLEDSKGNVKDTLEIVDLGKEGLPNGYVLYEDEGIPLTLTSVEEGYRIRMYSYSEGYGWEPLRGEPGSVLELPVFPENTVSNRLPVQPAGVELSFTPGNAELIIRSKSAASVWAAALYDLSGRMTGEKRFQQGNTQAVIPLSGMKAGIYILSVRTSEGDSRHKIILSQ